MRLKRRETKFKVEYRQSWSSFARVLSWLLNPMGAEVTLVLHRALPRVLFMPQNQVSRWGWGGSWWDERTWSFHTHNPAIYKIMYLVGFFLSHFHSQVTTVDSLTHVLSDFSPENMHIYIYIYIYIYTYIYIYITHFFYGSVTNILIYNLLFSLHVTL